MQLSGNTFRYYLYLHEIIFGMGKLIASYKIYFTVLVNNQRMAMHTHLISTIDKHSEMFSNNYGKLMIRGLQISKGKIHKIER